MNSFERFSAPLPEIQYLPALFRRIQLGEVGIPAFQRRFVWKEAQVIELFESVYRGFPIGSLLFWKVTEPILRVDRSHLSPLPKIPEKYPLSFVLDGLQRLSALYGVFHLPDKRRAGMFNIVFDLDAQQFRHFDAEDLPERYVAMSSLFSPKEFLETQRLLSSHPDSELLLDKAITLHATFQQYMVPTVTISDRDVGDVVSMFERINSTGTRLNAVDFMRAVTWSQNFDLNRELVALRNHLRARNFDIRSQTLVKGLAVLMGKEPTPNSMLELRQHSASELHDAVKRETDSLTRAIDFLEERFQIHSYEYVPYEGQLLALLRFFGLSSHPSREQCRSLAQWFWAVSFNEELRGKPDHYVTRILNRVDGLVDGDVAALECRLSISVDDLVERRFIRGKALSAAIASMFAVGRARSLVTGEIIPPEVYMRDFSATNFEGLLSMDALRKMSDRSVSNKLMANLVLVTDRDARDLRSSGRALIQRLLAERPSDAEEVLRSQFIDLGAARALLHNEVVEFLELRAAAMHRVAKALAAGAEPAM